MTVLTVATVVLILLLVAVLVVGLVLIARTLESIGGSPRGYTSRPSLLSKARWGVRAIEQQTSAIEPRVATLNRGLLSLNGALAEVEDELGGLVAALERQGGAR